MRSCKTILVLAALILPACDSLSPPELYIRYEASGDHYDEGVRDICWLTGPAETLVVGKITNDPEYFPPGDCQTDDPYRRGYTILEVAVDRTVGPDEVAGTIPIVAQLWNTGVLDLKAGDEIAASFRTSLGEAMLLAFIPLEVSTDRNHLDNGDNPRVDLPNTWSGLTASATPVPANHEIECTDVFTHGLSSARRMTQDEFDVWARTADKTCPADLPPEPENPTQERSRTTSYSAPTVQ